MRRTKAIITKNRRGNFYWKIVASNGRILAHSESYSSFTKAKNGLKALLRGLFFGKVDVIEEK